jgi:hypothetical protein
MIETKQFNSHIFPEINALNALVDEFAAAMKDRLMVKVWQGWRGWDDPQFEDQLCARLAHEAAKDDPDHVDVANLAAFLWNFKQGQNR